jgi:trigger factor
MQVDIQELSPCQKKLKIQLSADEVNQEYRTVMQELRRNVTIPGFRKGKASLNTIKRRFAQEIKNEVKEKLLEHSLRDALVQHKIAPIGTPSANVKEIKIAENQPVEYEVEVECLAPLEITDYKGVKITKPSVGEVPESQITQAMEALQRQNAVNEPVEDDHRIADHDSVTVNYRRTVDGEPFGEPVENLTIWLGVDEAIPEFRQNMIGKQKGDHVVFAVQYGEDAQNKQLAGKTMEFAVDIVNVEKVVLPAIDDEFAKDLEEESLDALKKRIEQDIHTRLEQDAIAAKKHEILMTLADTHVFDVPPSLIKEQQKKFPDKEEAELKKMLRAGIILSKIQAQEKITVSDAEVDAAVEKLAMRYQLPVAAMKGYLAKQNGVEQIRSDIAETKTLDFLYEQAQIVEGA